MTTHPANKILLPIQVIDGKMIANQFQGPRIASTVREAIDYGYEMMSARIDTLYETAEPEVKASWQKHADEYIERVRPQLFVPSTHDERQLVYQIADALELQRDREKEEAHLSHAATLDLWMSVAEKAEKYLTA